MYKHVKCVHEYVVERRRGKIRLLKVTYDPTDAFCIAPTIRYASVENNATGSPAVYTEAHNNCCCVSTGDSSKLSRHTITTAQKANANSNIDIIPQHLYNAAVQHGIDGWVSVCHTV